MSAVKTFSIGASTSLPKQTITFTKGGGSQPSSYGQLSLTVPNNFSGAALKLQFSASAPSTTQLQIQFYNQMVLLRHGRKH